LLPIGAKVKSCYKGQKTSSSNKKMNNEIVAIYCVCDDMLKAMNHRSDAQQQMSDAEVMTITIGTYYPNQL
jgi:hypothetical protein